MTWKFSCRRIYLIFLLYIVDQRRFQSFFIDISCRRTFMMVQKEFFYDNLMDLLVGSAKESGCEFNLIFFGL